MQYNYTHTHMDTNTHMHTFLSLSSTCGTWRSNSFTCFFSSSKALIRLCTLESRASITPVADWDNRGAHEYLECMKYVSMHAPHLWCIPVWLQMKGVGTTAYKHPHKPTNPHTYTHTHTYPWCIPNLVHSQDKFSCHWSKHVICQLPVGGWGIEVL